MASRPGSRAPRPQARHSRRRYQGQARPASGRSKMMPAGSCYSAHARAFLASLQPIACFLLIASLLLADAPLLSMLRLCDPSLTFPAAPVARVLFLTRRPHTRPLTDALCSCTHHFCLSIRCPIAIVADPPPSLSRTPDPKPFHWHPSCSALCTNPHPVAMLCQDRTATPRQLVGGIGGTQAGHRRRASLRET